LRTRGSCQAAGTRFGAAGIRDGQRFRHRIGQTIYCTDACICCVRSDICSSLERKAASEEPKGSEELLLVLAQQAVAPIDGPAISNEDRENAMLTSNSAAPPINRR
jgi:hypothetical protein